MHYFPVMGNICNQQESLEGSQMIMETPLGISIIIHYWTPECMSSCLEMDLSNNLQQISLLRIYGLKLMMVVIIIKSWIELLGTAQMTQLSLRKMSSIHPNQITRLKEKPPKDGTWTSSGRMDLLILWIIYRSYYEYTKWPRIKRRACIDISVHYFCKNGY